MGCYQFCGNAPCLPGLYKCVPDKKHFLLCLTQRLEEEKVRLHAIYTYVYTCVMR